MFIRETSTLDGTWGNAAVWIATSRAISRGNACGTRGYKRPRPGGHPSPGSVQSGQHASNAYRQMPQHSSSTPQVHVATPCHFLIVTFILRQGYSFGGFLTDGARLATKVALVKNLFASEQSGITNNLILNHRAETTRGTSRRETRALSPRESVMESAGGGRRGEEARGGGGAEGSADVHHQKRKRHAKKRRRAAGSSSSEPAKPEPKTEPATDGTKDRQIQWGCPACTFLNEPSRRFCEMCGTANPSQPAASAPIEWHCVACTMKNAPTQRSCGVCGTINPNPSPLLPSALSIARGSLRGGLFIAGDDEEDDDDDDDDDNGDDDDDEGNEDGDSQSGDDNGSSSEEGESDSDAQRRLECPCVECGMTIAADETTCSHCHALRLLPRRKLKRSDLSEKLHKLVRKVNKADKKASKSSKEGKKNQIKNAYGVSSDVLKKVMVEPKSSKLADTLQTLTHTLAMMDASADSEWGDMHGGSGAFLVHGFGVSSRSDKGKDTALLGVLSTIFEDDGDKFPPEVRVFAVQSINYLLKMDRHLFKKEEALSTVRIYLSALKKWSSAAASTKDNQQMMVEECVNGLSGLCGSEGAMLRELTQPDALANFIQFLTRLTGPSSVHSSVVSNALELFQRCCLRFKWEEKLTDEKTLATAIQIVTLLRSFMKHKDVSLHVTASKCLLMFVHRFPRKSEAKATVSAIVTPDLLIELIQSLTTVDAEEPDAARQATATLLMHLFDTRPEVLSSVIENKIYGPLFDGLTHLLSPTSTTSPALSSHALKLVSLLIRRISRASQPTDLGAIDSVLTRARESSSLRFDSAPDSTVLTILLLDFVGLDSVPAVSVLLKDGAELNFTSIYDASGRELNCPLVVASEVSSLSMVRYLIKRGAAVNHCGPRGTALHVAAASGRCDIVSFLLECGASPRVVDRQGRSVLKCLDDADASLGNVVSAKAPVRRLLDLHQRVLQLGEGSDGSEDDDGEPRRWSVSGSDHHHIMRDEADDDEGFDEEDDDHYFDYDDEDEDDDELDSEMESDASSDDEDGHNPDGSKSKSNVVTPSPADKKKRRRESIASNASDHKDTKKRRRADSTERRASTSPSKKRPAISERLTVSDEEAVAVSEKILQCLLVSLRVVDITHVNRSILSTLATALEMSPSSLVKSISESDAALMLETVSHLLLDSARVTSSGVDHGTPAPIVQPSTTGTDHSATGELKSMFASYVLAMRLLLAIARKSDSESSIFYEIERRGICEQLERLCNDNGFDPLLTKSSKATTRSSMVKAEDFGGMLAHGRQLLQFLRANIVESGMLVLHRLKNMTRRLRDVMDTTPASERDMVLVDLVELFDEQNAITSHEFKQSNLLEAILVFLVPAGASEPRSDRVSMLLSHFSKSSSAFTSFLNRLQAVVNQEENLPLLSFFTGKGRELYPLTKQIKVVCSRARAADRTEPEIQKLLQLSPLTHFQSFEKTIFRCLPVHDSRLNSYYFSLIGHCIQRAVDNKWKKFWVCGYDRHRSIHILKPLDDVADEAIEAVLHDSQYKLTFAVDVKEELALDFSLFGEPLESKSSTGDAEEKKRKRQNKKRRRSASGIDPDSSSNLVEVQNGSGLTAGKLKGAWYAGEIASNGTDSDDSALDPTRSYTIKLMSSGNVLKNVSGRLLRVRHKAPQVGSVVEVDGLLGEVSSIHRTKQAEDEASDNDLYDVKISKDRERKGIKRHRIRYPPSGNPGSSSSSGGIIEAMSLSRLFPPRQSSVVAGSVGDRVWIPSLTVPSSSPSSGDFFLAGRIHSFPAGAESIGESASVFVEVSFGKSSSVIKVLQSRVLNLATGRNRVGSSRLLSALQMASERNSGPSGGSLQRLLQSGNRELFSNRPTGDATSFDHLRQLLSHSSSTSTRELPWASFSAATASTDSLGTGTSTTTVTSDGDAKSSSCTKEEDAATRLNRIWKLVKVGDRKKNWKCVRPPRVSVLVGYEKCVNVDAVPFGHGIEEEYGASSVFSSTGRRTTESEKVLTMEDPATKRTVLRPTVVAALTEVFKFFDGQNPAKSGKKNKKKKRKTLSFSEDVETKISSAAEVVSWDVDKFCAFTAQAYGQSPVGDPEGTLVDNCVEFSMFAAIESRRRELTLDGFLSSVLEVCTSATRTTRLLSFLKARGHAISAAKDKKGANGEPDINNDVAARDLSSKTMMQLISSDQNMLKCLTELQRTQAPQDMANSASPPWKLKYYVNCDLSVEWTDGTKKHDSDKPDSTSIHSSIVSDIEGVGAESTMMKSVRLLRFLYDALPRNLTVADEVWQNARLTKKVKAQMEDVLSVCSGVYPAWCDAVISECKFFFPREVREKLFRATAFGCTRSLHWFRNQLNMDDSSNSTVAASSMDGTSNGIGIAADGIYNHEISISPIPKERVKVNRESILDSADAVMKMHGKRKAILDIVFIGEKGYGSGVTAAFYSATAHALQSVAESKTMSTRCWVPGIENEREDESIRHPNGLFPFPHINVASTAKVVQRFRMMGRLAGKALMDDRLFPLPLAKEFMQLVVGQRVDEDALDRIFLQHGKVLKSLKRATEALEAGAKPKDVVIDGMPIIDWLAAVDLSFLDPLSQQPLEPTGDDKPVTIENIKTYVDQVTALWLHDGIRAQVDAFREGLSEVLPVPKLKLLFVPELLAMLCGDADILWDTDSLLSTMKLAHGYTKDSLPVQYFVEALVAMSVAERREFLLYATGCPNLPAGGFAALKPVFEVVRRVVETDNVDQALPFARTCTNTLHLPAYSAKRVLDERLRFAIANSAGVIDRD